MKEESQSTRAHLYFTWTLQIAEVNRESSFRWSFNVLQAEHRWLTKIWTLTENKSQASQSFSLLIFLFARHHMHLWVHHENGRVSISTTSNKELSNSWYISAPQYRWFAFEFTKKKNKKIKYEKTPLNYVSIKLVNEINCFHASVQLNWFIFVAVQVPELIYSLQSACQKDCNTLNVCTRLNDWQNL